ncbi:uncharacterized protein LOC113933741 isoform X5 [Zalophus californianus]|uniref:Uncharacterized protein LOC113933741 isoform X5 n=1 Tax=Zalophus californianus TaxID=9704 RepID=A0A6J2EM18_ZALCA|nr:uncharacterized protein LOC113933741 isoform X5 [Zalophus californianus]
MTPYTVLFPEVGRGDPGSQPRRPRKSAEATPEASRGDPGRPPRRPWPATALGSLQVLSSGEELGYRLPLAATTGPSVSDARNGCKWTGQRPIQQAHLEDHKLLRTGKAGLIHLVQPRGSCEHTPVVGPPRASPCPPHTILTNCKSTHCESARKYKIIGITHNTTFKHSHSSPDGRLPSKVFVIYKL